MKTARFWCMAVSAGLILASGARAQQPQVPKPGPDHEVLKKLEGTWDATVKMMGMESKGTMVYKMDVGGLWLTSSFEGDFGGMKFQGKGLDSYDGTKKKYVGVWVDSMSTLPMNLEGTFDKDKKTMTMVGEASVEGKPTKHTMVTAMKDDDNMVFHMYMGDAKEPMFEIVYKRKK